MASGFLPADWAATWDGEHGTVTCGKYRARFTTNRSGLVRIVWVLDGGPAPGSDYGELSRAAEQAAYRAVEG